MSYYPYKLSKRDKNTWAPVTLFLILAHVLSPFSGMIKLWMVLSMKKVLLLILLVIGAFQWQQSRQLTQPNITIAPTTSNSVDVSSDHILRSAFDNRQSDIQVKGAGKVIKVLPDDNEGSRHQKFILKLSNGQTLLVAHNIDLAPRISSISNGDHVQFFGEYEWNSKGGVIHWTHHDPNGRHVGGWLKHKGRTYQ